MTNLPTSGAFVILESATALHMAFFATAQADLLVVVLALGLAFDLAFAAALVVAAAFADVRQVSRLAATSALGVLESAVGLDMALLAAAKTTLSVCIETAPISIGVGSAPLAYMVWR